MNRILLCESYTLLGVIYNYILLYKLYYYYYHMNYILLYESYTLLGLYIIIYYYINYIIII